MLDTRGHYPTAPEIQRRRESDRALWLMVPTFLCVVLPIAYFVAVSVYHGRDEFEPLRQFIDTYPHAVTVVLVGCVSSLFPALFMIIVSDMMRAKQARAAEHLLDRFAPLYRRRMTKGEQIAGRMLLTVAVGFCALVAYLMLR